MLPRIISIWLDILFVVPGKRKGSSVMCIVVMRTESVCALLVFMARHNTKITAKKKKMTQDGCRYEDDVMQIYLT